jgi:hypothetical protein
MDNHHKWEIEVAAGSYYPDLSQSFYGNDVELGYEDDVHGMLFFAYSRHADELDSLDHVAQRLYSIQLLLNGALRLEQGRIHPVPIQFKQFASIDNGSRRPVFAKAIEENPFSQNPGTHEVTADWSNPRGRYASRLLHLSKADTDLRALLFLVGLVAIGTPAECILTWGTLYKIYDTVAHHSRLLLLSVGNFADTNQVEAFRAACNNMSVLGIYARHGARSNPRPTRVITDLETAVNLIVAMASNFCHEYVKAKHS